MITPFFRSTQALLILCLATIGQSRADLPRIQSNVTRTWIGPEYWANPLMNWRLTDGRIECSHGGWVNELHSLTHQLKPGKGTFTMNVTTGLLERQGVFSQETIFAGFTFAALGHRNDYRANILHDIADGFGAVLQQERPVRAGITNDGRLVVGTKISETVFETEDLSEIKLGLSVSYDEGSAKVRLTATGPNGSPESLSALIERESLTGNMALACHPLQKRSRSRHDHSDPDHPTFWFSNWNAKGDKIDANLGQTYDPILWTQYTTSRGVLKLMAFFVPMEDLASKSAKLQIKRSDRWATIAESEIDPLSLTALFRVENWNESQGADYRVTYDWRSTFGDTAAYWGGRIRKSPTGNSEVKLAGLSCSNSEIFPYSFFVSNLIDQDPDLVFFSGDQIYEPNGGYGIVFAGTDEDVPRAVRNYLGKFWYLGVGFRDLIKDRPTVMIPDDHDVYSNDLWGKSGSPMPGDGEANTMRCFGGYRMHPRWVEVVEHTQMGHHPDPFDDTTVEQGINARYTSVDVGEVSFALINDRKFKSAPGDVIDAMEPLFAMRGERNLPKLDTINEKNFDTRKLDRNDLTLLGERQLEFLQEWGQGRSKMRAVLSQSPYCQPHHLMVADFDSNGWPQSARDRALRVIRDTGAVMIHGDLHFATLVQQGTDDWEDAGWAFTLPAVSSQTHRAWRPEAEPRNHIPGMPDYTGRFFDGWGNKITIWAAANPFSFVIGEDYQGEGRATLDYMREGGLGYGIVRFDTKENEVTFESWPVFGSFKGPGNHQQHPGFPWTVKID